MDPPKLRDVAKKAGVSLATASNILNGKGQFSQDVKHRVLSVAKALGYRKNIYAASVAKKSTSHIGVLVHEDYEKAFEWDFIRHMLIQIESVITRAGYYPVLIPVSLKQKKVEILKKINASGTGALFSIHYGNRELFTMLEDSGIPVIVINNSNYQDRFFSVCVDDFQGAYEGTLYLFNLGHENLLYVEYFRPDIPSVVADRFIGFKKAVEERGVNFPDENRITIDLYDMDSLFQGLKRVFLEGQHRPKPTAIFAHDDYLAARIIVVLNKLGLKIPEDISIIAPGDTLDYNQPFIPRITTMRIDTEMLGKLAGEMMIQRLSGAINSIQVLKVKQHLIERGSCRAL